MTATERDDLAIDAAYPTEADCVAAINSLTPDWSWGGRTAHELMYAGYDVGESGWVIRSRKHLPGTCT